MNELLNELFFVLEEKKKFEKQEKELKEKIEAELMCLNQSKFESENLKVTLVPESTSTIFDTTAFKKKEAELYEDLLKDYQKTTTRKAYLKVTVI